MARWPVSPSTKKKVPSRVELPVELAVADRIRVNVPVAWLIDPVNHDDGCVASRRSMK
jgi:hypothetical protein